MKRLFTLGLTLLLLSTAFLGCTNNSNKSIDELIEKFDNQGFNGTRTNKYFSMVGAIDGCGYKNADFSIEIYKFGDNKVSDMLPYKNGCFGMLINETSNNSINEKLVTTFKDF